MGVVTCSILFSPVPKGNAASLKYVLHYFSDVAQQIGSRVWIILLDGRNGKLCQGVAPLEADCITVALISNLMDLIRGNIQ